MIIIKIAITATSSANRRQAYSNEKCRLDQATFHLLIENACQNRVPCVRQGENLLDYHYPTLTIVPSIQGNFYEATEAG